MRISERMGLVFTGLFLTVSVAVITQNSDTLMAMFRGEAPVRAVDDIFTGQSGRDQRLFVLKNDVNANQIALSSVRLVSQPACGRVSMSAGSLLYTDSATCSGNVSFSYCVSTGKTCEPAKVTLRLAGMRDPIDSIAAGPAVALGDFGPQLEMNRTDLEISNVRLGRVAPSENAPKPIADSKLARVAVESNASFQKPAPLEALPAVRGSFTVDVPVSRLAPSMEASTVAELTDTGHQTDAAFDADQIPLALPHAPTDLRDVPGMLSSLPVQLDKRLLTFETGIASPASLIEYDQSPFGTTCTSDLAARVLPGAIAELTLKAPCYPNSRVEIRHGKLRAAFRTGHTGNLVARIPAFEINARFELRFANGTSLKTRAFLPELRNIERAAIQWGGGLDANLHALEYGADVGGDGHVWAGRARSYDKAVRYGGGYILSLGDPSVETPMRVQVYSIPRPARPREGVVELLVAASTNPGICGAPQVVRGFRSKGGRLVGATGLQFKMPDCGDETQSLVLKNVLRDLIIAAK